MCVALAHWLRLLAVWVRAAASRTFCTAGTSRPMRMAIIAITTSNSISVKPGRPRSLDLDMDTPPQKERNRQEIMTSLPALGAMVPGKAVHLHRFPHLRDVGEEPHRQHFQLF